MSSFNDVEAPPLDSTDGQDSPHLSSFMSSCPPITLKFIDVCYKIKIESRAGWNLSGSILGKSSNGTNKVREKTVVSGINGMALPGEILAVLGPSGSGKSTLLNGLTGRLRDDGLTGKILANNSKMNRKIMKRTGFVTQDDVLYPHLTVRETLVFCSLLRLSKTMSYKEKVTVAESVIVELGLSRCENTIIGNTFIRGISGGERKRVSIGHEMLINPSLLILDEPTSGLDSTAAYRLMMTLESLARKGKTIVTSMHQPSSRVYQMFDSVLVLSEGGCLYYGKASEAMAYFESLGFLPSFAMNPADFLLDLANGGICQLGSNEKDKANTVRQSLISSYNTILAPKIKTTCLVEPATNKDLDSKSRYSNPRITVPIWFSQFVILLQRSLKERKYESFNSLRLVQVVTAALLAGLMWWHSEYTNIQDRLGLLFFFTIFWGVFPSSNSAFVFPQEHMMLIKERSTGMYTLSSYFMARVVGDLPMELIPPTIFLSMAYWMTGLRPEFRAFLLTLTTLLGYVLVSQGLGLAFGAILMDARKASMVVTVTMLAFVLTGGFYVHNVPTCLAWIKYVSSTFYSYRLLIYAQYEDGRRISSDFGCSGYGSSRLLSAKCKFIEQDVQGQISPLLSAGALMFMFVGYRLLAYLALRRIKV